MLCKIYAHDSDGNNGLYVIPLNMTLAVQFRGARSIAFTVEYEWAPNLLEHMNLGSEVSRENADNESAMIYGV